MDKIVKFEFTYDGDLEGFIVLNGEKILLNFGEDDDDQLAVALGDYIEKIVPCINQMPDTEEFTLVNTSGYNIAQQIYLEHIINSEKYTTDGYNFSGEFDIEQIIIECNFEE